ncbi:hypothetical protein NM688_g4224 [Phlebia brevispora]|uniref:Uncharacterized protein n=1 Tax=Phlebia brevispora TaxID=194682 RepID=A0ACC1T3R3_9APHY|nr:hypothetical protein NM688_g4224 [Phlebia brevispora]
MDTIIQLVGRVAHQTRSNTSSTTGNVIKFAVLSATKSDTQIAFEPPLFAATANQLIDTSRFYDDLFGTHYLCLSNAGSFGSVYHQIRFQSLALRLNGAVSSQPLTSSSRKHTIGYNIARRLREREQALMTRLAEKEVTIPDFAGTLLFVPDGLAAPVKRMRTLRVNAQVANSVKRLGLTSLQGLGTVACTSPDVRPRFHNQASCLSEDTRIVLSQVVELRCSTSSLKRQSLPSQDDQWLEDSRGVRRGPARRLLSCLAVMSEPEHFRTTYNEVHKLIRASAAKIAEFKPDIFIAIGDLPSSRRGFFPARVLRTFLKDPATQRNIPIVAIGLSLYEALPGTTAEQIGAEVIRTQWLGPEGAKILLGKRALIVDEIDDSRKTLQYAVSELQSDVEKELLTLPEGEREAKRTSFAVFVVHNKRKAKLGKLPPELPYYAGAEVEDLWLDYPWEAIDIDEHDRLAAAQRQADKHVLKNVTRVERFIQDVIRKTIEEELVFPNFHTLVLPEPQQQPQ